MTLHSKKKNDDSILVKNFFVPKMSDNLKYNIFLLKHIFEIEI